MSQHARTALVLDRQQQEPKHSKGWTYGSEYTDQRNRYAFRTLGKHAKPFGKHHPATPITKATTANVIPLRATPALQLAA